MFDEAFRFLDVLRESGVTNMYGAGQYLEDEFPGLSRNDAQRIVFNWMDTFSERHPE